MTTAGSITSGISPLPARVGGTNILVQRPEPESSLSPGAQRLLGVSIETVNERVRIGDIKLPYPLTLAYGLSGNSLSATFSFDQRSREGLVLFNPGFIEEITKLEGKVPGLGRAVLESLIVNEYHGIIAAGVAKPGELTGSASKVLEEGSNQASRAYINRHHADRAYTEEALAVWNRISKDIAEGNAPYQNRPKGTAREETLSGAAIQLLGLGPNH